MPSVVASYKEINPQHALADEFIFSPRDAPLAGTAWVAEDSYCIQSSCPCRLVVLQLRYLSGYSDAAAPPGETFCLHLDTQELRDSDDRPLDPLHFPLAFAFRDMITEEALSMWHKHYMQGRAYGREYAWRHRRWELEPGDLIALSEVWEDVPPLLVCRAETSGFTVQERYCPSPVCDCQEVLLSLVDSTQGEPLREAEESLVRLKFNGRFDIEEEGPMTAAQVREGVRAVVSSPGSLKRFRDHYRAIKKVGTELAKRYPELAIGWGMRTQERSAGSSGTIAGARPGRNDPCTCGSGRKFKQCCGR